MAQTNDSKGQVVTGRSEIRKKGAVSVHLFWQIFLETEGTWV